MRRSGASEMVERVAAVLASYREGYHWTDLVREARDVIEAMREPTDEMIAAAWGVVRSRYPSGQLMGPGPAFVEAMQAMIDASLEKQPA
jgi:hypothetical protein